MFNRFKSITSITSDLKTTIRKEEVDGKHEDETVVHKALIKYFKENNRPLPDWLPAKVDHHHNQEQGDVWNKQFLTRFSPNIPLPSKGHWEQQEQEQHLQQQPERLNSRTPSSRFTNWSHTTTPKVTTATTSDIPQYPLPANKPPSHHNTSKNIIQNNINHINNTAKTAVSSFKSSFSSSAPDNSNRINMRSSSTPHLLSSTQSSNHQYQQDHNGSGNMSRPDSAGRSFSYGTEPTGTGTGRRVSRFAIRKGHQ